MRRTAGRGGHGDKLHIPIRRRTTNQGQMEKALGDRLGGRKLSFKI